jgi:hypothetical protein
MLSKLISCHTTQGIRYISKFSAVSNNRGPPVVVKSQITSIDHHNFLAQLEQEQIHIFTETKNCCMCLYRSVDKV